MRFLGVNIPDNKRIEVALTAIYGIGLFRAREVLKRTGVDFNARTKDLTAEELNAIKADITRHYKIEGELRLLVRRSINLLKELQTYRGIRHMKKLPIRGQRTRTNSRTIRGNVRKTAGSGKRKIELK